MNDIVSKLILIALIGLAVSCGRNKKHQHDEPPGQTLAEEEAPVEGSVRLRGYSELSQIVESNLMNTYGKFSFAQYVGGGVEFFGGANGIAPLMGYYNNDPMNSHWQNTESNTVNTAVYLIAFQSFASELALICDPANEADQMNDFNDTTKRNILTYCQQGTAMPQSELKDLWKLLTLNMAPESDFEIWSKALTLVDGKPNPEKIDFLVSVSLTSPWVLFHY